MEVDAQDFIPFLASYSNFVMEVNNLLSAFTVDSSDASNLRNICHQRFFLFGRFLDDFEGVVKPARLLDMLRQVSASPPTRYRIFNFLKSDTRKISQHTGMHEKC